MQAPVMGPQVLLAWHKRTGKPEKPVEHAPRTTSAPAAPLLTVTGHATPPSDTAGHCVDTSTQPAPAPPPRQCGPGVTYQHRPTYTSAVGAAPARLAYTPAQDALGAGAVHARGTGARTRWAVAAGDTRAAAGTGKVGVAAGGAATHRRRRACGTRGRTRNTQCARLWLEKATGACVHARRVELQTRLGTGRAGGRCGPHARTAAGVARGASAVGGAKCAGGACCHASVGGRVERAVVQAGDARCAAWPKAVCTWRRARHTDGAIVRRGIVTSSAQRHTCARLQKARRAAEAVTRGRARTALARSMALGARRRHTDAHTAGCAVIARQAGDAIGRLRPVARVAVCIAPHTAESTGGAAAAGSIVFTIAKSQAQAEHAPRVAAAHAIVCQRRVAIETGGATHGGIEPRRAIAAAVALQAVVAHPIAVTRRTRRAVGAEKARAALPTDGADQRPSRLAQAAAVAFSRAVAHALAARGARDASGTIVVVGASTSSLVVRFPARAKIAGHTQTRPVAAVVAPARRTAHGARASARQPIRARRTDRFCAGERTPA
jgi:hypothetical protein